MARRRTTKDREQTVFATYAGGSCDPCFIDSAGLGGDVRLLRPQPRVRDVFEATALTLVFRIFDAEAEAVASFRS